MNGQEAPLTATIAETVLAHELERWPRLRCVQCQSTLSKSPPGSRIVARADRRAVTEIQCRACGRKNYLVPPATVLP